MHHLNLKVYIVAFFVLVLTEIKYDALKHHENNVVTVKLLD